MKRNAMGSPTYERADDYSSFRYVDIERSSIISIGSRPLTTSVLRMDHSS